MRSAGFESGGHDYENITASDGVLGLCYTALEPSVIAANSTPIRE